MKKIRFIDLFSGCGGLSEAFLENKNFLPVKIIDNDQFCYRTAMRRLERFDFKDFRKIVEQKNISKQTVINQFKNIKVDLVLGGPPCQAYSVAGRIRDKYGMKKDYRNFLFESFLKIIKLTSPNFFVMENVPGMLSAKPGNTPVTERIQSAVKRAGYFIPGDLKNCVFDFSNYRVPQKRKRVIIFGVKKGIKNYRGLSSIFYSSLRSSSSDRIVTVIEAIGDLDRFLPLKKLKKINGKKYSHSFYKTKVKDHIPRFHNRRDIKIFKTLTEDINTKRNRYKSVKQLQKLYTRIVGKKSNIHKYYVLRKNEPSNLIPSHLYKDGLRHIHYDPKQSRSITVREAARLQTFPDDFEFVGPMTEQYKMIGNAVPPKFSKTLSKTLVKIFNN